MATVHRTDGVEQVDIDRHLLRHLPSGLFNLHLKTTGVTQLWRVRKPSVDGIITSYEGFDAEGELVIQLFGVRKPGIPERDDWRALAEIATPLIG
ncbi:ChuX/HutX family heme-like substrate-binding protein [Pseudomonas sp. P8_241]|nr:ChuX/HutX family heme-like substrate-binding protein [Pseudomonas sp. P8_241]